MNAMDMFTQNFVVLAHKFLEMDARKFETFKDQLFKEFDQKVTNAVSISPETQEQIKALMDRLGNSVEMPELEIE